MEALRNFATWGALHPHLPEVKPVIPIEAGGAVSALIFETASQAFAVGFQLDSGGFRPVPGPPYNPPVFGSFSLSAWRRETEQAVYDFEYFG